MNDARSLPSDKLRWAREGGLTREAAPANAACKREEQRTTGPRGEPQHTRASEGGRNRGGTRCLRTSYRTAIVGVGSQPCGERRGCDVRIKTTERASRTGATLFPLYRSADTTHAPIREGGGAPQQKRDGRRRLTLDRGLVGRDRPPSVRVD